MPVSKTSKRGKKTVVKKKNKNIQKNTNTAKVVVNIGKDKPSRGDGTPQPVYIQAGLPPISNTPLFNPINTTLPRPTLTAQESAPILNVAPSTNSQSTQTDGLTNQIADVQQRIQQFEMFKPPARPSTSVGTQVEEIQKKLKAAQSQTDIGILPDFNADIYRVITKPMETNQETSTSVDAMENINPILEPQVVDGKITIFNPSTKRRVELDGAVGKSLMIQYPNK